MNKDESLDHEKQNIVKRAKGVEIPDEKPFVNLPEIFTRWFYHHHVFRLRDTFDLPTSWKLAKEIDASLDRCHENCTNAMLHMKKCDFYIGYVIMENKSKKEASFGRTQHSWLVSHNNNTIIDPTLGIPCKIKKQKNGNWKRILQNVKPHESYLKNYWTTYIGVKIPEKFILNILKFKETHFESFQHHYLEEYFLINELKTPLKQVCIKLEYGRVGYTQLMVLFEKTCKASDKKINNKTKDREDGMTYNKFMQTMEMQGSTFALELGRLGVLVPE